MFPSEKNPFVGTFVSNFKKSLECRPDFKFTLSSLIKGKTASKGLKAINYFSFFLDVLYKSIFFHGKFDYYYIHYINHSVVPLLIVQLWSSKPIVLNAHGGDVLPETKLNRILQKITLPILQKAKLIIVPSSYYAQIIEKSYRVDRSKIFISPSSGINSKIFHPLKKMEESIFTIGFVSRIIKKKGWDTFLLALSELQQHVNFRAYIIGSGEQKNELLSLRRELNLEECTIYHEALSQSQLNSYYNLFDIFIFPSERESESLGLVGIEAMACQTPVIGSNIPGIMTYLEDKKNGFIFNAGDKEDLKNKIIQYYFLTCDEKRKLKNHAFSTSIKYREEHVIEQLSTRLKEEFN